MSPISSRLTSSVSMNLTRLWDSSRGICATLPSIEQQPYPSNEIRTKDTRPSESTSKSAKTLPPWRHKQKRHGLLGVVQTYFEISIGVRHYWCRRSAK